MAFNVNFYQFYKEDNSTSRPSGTSSTYPCTIKHGSGLVNPTIILNIGLTSAPTWNYCYIPDFRRYYYVSEWYYDKAFWTATLTCDVLATYKAEIGDSYLYALRSSSPSLYDKRIPDTMYPTKVNCTYDRSTVSNPWQDSNAGCFVVGIVGKSPNFGSINYYVMNRTAMSGLIQGLLDDTIDPSNGFDLADASEGLQLALVDPLQYIKSAVFIPLDYADVSGVPSPIGAISVFNYLVNTGGSYKIIINQPFTTITKTFTTKKHPQTLDRGNWVNQSPYTNCTLTFPPFGTIELDTTVLCDVDSFTVEIRIDNTTGLGILEVKAHNIILNRLESQIGVPVQLSQVTRDYMGAMNNIMGAAQGVAGAVGSALTGNYAGAVGSGIGAVAGIGNALASLVPRSQSIGSGGSFAQLYETPQVNYQFFEVVDDDLAKNGRPTCKIVQPKIYGGYYLIQDGDVAIDGTKEESAQVRSYLETGFFWE